MAIKGVYFVLNEATGEIAGQHLVVESDNPAQEAKRYFEKVLRNKECALYVRVGKQHDFEAQPWNNDKGEV